MAADNYEAIDQTRPSTRRREWSCWATLKTHDELSVCLLPHDHRGPHEWTFVLGREPVYFGA